MELVRFNAALGLHRAQMDNATYWRYTNGRLPKVLRWLVERPELVQALAADAAELAKTGRDEPIVAGEDTERG